MGSQGPGRKRTPSKKGLTGEEDALNVIAREAEARLAAKRAARAEAREIRMKELERQQKEVSDDEERMSVGSRSSVRADDRLERDYLEKGSSRASTISGATLTSLGGTSSRRGSGDTSISADTEASVREIKDSMLEVEEKYRKAMVSNAQLDNEKTNLIYEVDTLKDSLMELEEMLYETRRELEEKSKDFEREKHAHSILQFQFSELKETLKQSEELLTKHGIVLGPDLATNGVAGEEMGEADQSTRTSSAEIREGSSVLGTHQLKLCKDQQQKDLDEEVQEKLSSQVPLSSTKKSLETNENGDLRDKMNKGVEQQSDNRSEEPQSSVGDDELTETKPKDEIKGEQIVIEDSGGNTVESECDVHTDGPTEEGQQETMICAKHSQTIQKESTVESVSGPILIEDQIGEASLDNKSTAMEEPVKSSENEKLPQTQGASASNKKRKKKKKSKQKPKQSDRQESVTNIDDKSGKVLSENYPSHKMENDLEGNHEEHLENDVSTAMNTNVPDDSHDDQRNIEMDCVEIIHTNIKADDAREKFQVITDVVDLAESAIPISNFDCPEPRTGNSVPSEVSISNLTDFIDNQTEDSTNPSQQVSLEKEALLSHELSDKPMDGVDTCVETPESISSSDNIENSLLVDSKHVTSNLDAVEEEARLGNIEPDRSTIVCDHDEPALKNHPSSTVIEKVENEGRKLIQEQLTVPVAQEVESHLQNSIEVDLKEDKKQQDELVEGALIMPSKDVFCGDSNIDAAVTEFHVQPNLEKGEGEEEERSLNDHLQPEAHLTGEDEENQKPLDLGASDQESQLERGEDGKEGSFHEQAMLDTQVEKGKEDEKEGSFQEHIMLGSQLPVKNEDFLVEKGDEDEKEGSFNEQVMLDTQMPGEDEDIQVEKGQEDEKEGSFHEQVMLDTQLPEEDEDIQVEKGQEDEKEGSFKDQVMLGCQLPVKNEDILVEKGQEDEKEGSFHEQVMLDTQLPEEDEDIQVEKGEDDEKEVSFLSFQDQVILDKQLPRVNEGILVESVTVSPELKDEDEEEDEGESFDFDDMDLEASSDAPPKNCQDQPNEEVTPIKESMQEACKDYPSNIIDGEQIQEDGEHLVLQNDGHAIKNSQTTTEEEACSTEDSQVDKKDLQSNQQHHDTSQSKECTFETHQQASEELRHNEGAELISETETRAVGQEINSSIVHENQGLRNSGEQEVERETTRNNKEDDRKESKKSSKKGKGKGKEECKMS